MLKTIQLILLLCSISTSFSYLLIINENQEPGDVIFNASIYKLGSERHYKINAHKSAHFVHKLLWVNPKNGQVILKEGLNCNGVYYPNLFTVHIESTSTRLRSIDYYSLPLRVFVVGDDCDHIGTTLGDVDYFLYSPHEDRDKRSLTIEKRIRDEKLSNTFGVRKKRDVSNVNKKIGEVKQWVGETYASFAIPTTDRWQKICLRKSQFVNSIQAFLPQTINENCRVQYLDVSDPRFRIEQTQGDLVASNDLCIVEPLWKVVILFSTQCNSTEKIRLIDTEHRLKIVYHHQEFNDTDIAKRIRRELRNQSPFFEQALYVASVLEECEPGIVVTTVKARDPENSPVKYSMTSLLDSRTQKMFDIDPKMGTITTKVKLDRELIDVHYLRIKAEDDSFPPRSGTTTLQINVLDANDHSPVFEMNEYDASVREGVSVGTTVITLKATDQDIGKNAEVYALDLIISGTH